MRGRRRVPISTLRARLAERVASRDDPALFEREKESAPGGRVSFYPLQLLKNMHSRFLFKVTVAVAVVFIAALTSSWNVSWGGRLLEGLRFVIRWQHDFGSLYDRAVPAFNSIRNSLGLERLSGETGDRGQAPALPGVAPLRAGTLQSGFGLRLDPATGQEQMHYGIDLAAARGSAVTAVLPGKVREISESEGALTIVLEHDEEWQSIYGGLDKSQVTEGDTVKRGQLLGTLGEARLWELPHLDFELRWRERPVEPPAGWLAQFSGD